MNLYDELITILQDGKELGFTYDEIDDIIKALERAKKVEELLGLYKELSFIRKFEYKKQQPSDTEIMCMNEIKQLEEELK